MTVGAEVCAEIPCPILYTNPIFLFFYIIIYINPNVNFSRLIFSHRLYTWCIKPQFLTIFGLSWMEKIVIWVGWIRFAIEKIWVHTFSNGFWYASVYMFFYSCDLSCSKSVWILWTTRFGSLCLLIWLISCLIIWIYLSFGFFWIFCIL